jgi:hypothetical protein
MRRLWLFLLFAPAGLLSQQASNALTKTEVVVLVDLSDRIDLQLHPGQAQRDTTIIRAIADEFANVVRRNRYLFSHDRLRALFVGGENQPLEPRVDVGQMNLQHRVVVRELPKELRRFELEASAPLFAKRKNYVGADLWSWFKFNAPRQLVNDDPNRAIRRRIIILTDGYLQFSPKIKRDPGTAMRMDLMRGRTDWERIYAKYALKPTGSTLPDTKVLLLELAPVRPEVYTTEEEILRRYWTDWFRSMSVQTDLLTNREALPTIQDEIRRFLQ